MYMRVAAVETSHLRLGVLVDQTCAQEALDFTLAPRPQQVGAAYSQVETAQLAAT